jgi:fatty-acyl-CoA synthase
MTYVEMLVAALERAGDRPVVRRDGRDTTGRELLASTFRYARALDRLGVGRGNLVALFAPNRPEALAVRYAANLLGAGTVYLSAPASGQRRAAMIRTLDPDLLVVFPETAGLLPTGVGGPVVTVGAAGTGIRRLDVLAAVEPGDPVPSRARPEDLAVVVSSGGTTGVPKGSWRTFDTYTAMVAVPSPPDRRQLANGKLAYLTQALVDTTLLGGGCVVLADGVDPAGTLADIERERITDLFLVEPQLFTLMDHPDVARRDLSSLRSLLHIGALAPPVLRSRARQRLGPVVAHTYGASEMGLVSALSPAENTPARFTCAGRIRPGVDVRLRRPDGSLAGPGLPGTIEVRSPAMAGGYRNQPERQGSAFVDGWYRTGDLGTLDADGYLHIHGRAPDIRWTRGAMVSPLLVQDTLCRLPSVRYAVVVVDPVTGAWVVPAEAWPGATIDPAECVAAVAAAYGPSAADPLVILPVDHIPLTEQGKPDRTAITALPGRRAAA